MNKKRTLFTILALVLVCVISIAGTVAYMSMQGGSVENTFIAAGGGKLADSLTLVENKVEQQADGSYALTAETTNKNSYQVMPGMTLPKNPTITVNGKTDAAAYLYVEVVSGLDANYIWAMDDAWVELTGVTGAKGGKVYVYGDADDAALVLNSTNVPASIAVIKDNEITVATDAQDLSTTGVDLKFFAYMAQAVVDGSSDAAAVYDACF